MQPLADLLKIRAGEGRLATLVIGVMLVTSAGYSLGSTGIEALFFARFGVQFLPYMFMVLGTLSFVTSLGITALLGRVRRETLYVALPIAIALVLAGAWALLFLNLSALYPALWLGKEVLNSLMSLVVWGVAGAVCDTRQAKRLFPLFGAGRILGSVIGGLSTGGLVALMGTQNLLLAWALAMLIAFGLSRALLARARPGKAARPTRARARPQPGIIIDMQQGYQFVRRSPLMRWVSVAAILFSILYFSIALPFSKAATAQFADEDALAGFLGLFNGLSTGAAFLASLFLANRLFARFGIMRAILALPLIYLVGFGALAAYAIFPVIVAFRFVQMLWLAGIADSAYQAMFNAVPPERRDRVRAFIGGVPEQAGTFIAGAILIVGEQAFAPQQLYLVGLAAAALTTFIIWRAARAYNHALVEALRAGQPTLFLHEEEPFGGFQRDAAAIQIAVDGVRDREPAVRRISAEILGNLPVPRATDALVGALDDDDAHVRAASLRALARAKASHALLEVAARLRDPEAEVRAQAVEALRQLASYPGGLTAHLAPLLDDPAALVRARAAVGLLTAGQPAGGTALHGRARDLLRSMAVLGEMDERLQALNALADWGDAEAFALIEAELADAHAPAAVRRQAAIALAACGTDAITPLIAALADDDGSVRDGAALALARVGPAALAPTAAALFDSASEAGALLALERLPAADAGDSLRRYAGERISLALHSDDLWRGAEPHATDDRLRLLADSLRDRAHRHGLNALRALSLLGDGDRDTYVIVIQHLQSRDANQRANALETLESVRQSAIVRPLLRVWEAGQSPAAEGPLEACLGDLLKDGDAWVRACAALAAGSPAAGPLRDSLAHLAHADDDALVRETASLAVNEREAMDTLPTLSLMDRILCLRRVPLFADLSPADLKRLAAVATEHRYPDGELIAAEGEPGEEMFVIISGEVRVLVGPDGGPGREATRRSPGDVVGEMSVISGEPRSASLAAAGDVRLLCIDSPSFQGVLRERPDVSLALMRVLCQRLKEATR